MAKNIVICCDGTVNEIAIFPMYQNYSESLLAVNNSEFITILASARLAKGTSGTN